MIFKSLDEKLVRLGYRKLKNRDGDYNFYMRMKCYEIWSFLCVKEYESVKELFLKDFEILF